VSLVEGTPQNQDRVIHVSRCSVFCASWICVWWILRYCQFDLALIENLTMKLQRRTVAFIAIAVASMCLVRTGLLVWRFELASGVYCYSS